ncbi:MAG TPA: hypothetical protein VGQ83_22390 [Polyangia bacterium]|jgi:hypothetical protein
MESRLTAALLVGVALAPAQVGAKPAHAAARSAAATQPKVIKLDLILVEGTVQRPLQLVLNRSAPELGFEPLRRSDRPDPRAALEKDPF